MPVSSDRSSNSMRWVTLSRFRQTTICPATIFAGLGLSDAGPATATTSITTIGPEVNEGPAGFAVLELADDPQPQTQRPPATAAAAAKQVRILVRPFLKHGNDRNKAAIESHLFAPPF